MTEDIKARLEYLRGEIDAERISQGELVELQGLAEHIDPSDVQLLEWAGVPEHKPETEYVVTWSMAITADDATDAAQQALGIHRDPESIATVFFVEDTDAGTRWKVDLHSDGTVNDIQIEGNA